jgi:hypothetical protein
VHSEDGKRFSKPQLVGGVEKLALGMRRGPRVAATEKNFVVSAISQTDGNLYCWSATSSAERWTRVRINDIQGCAREGLHAMAAASGEKVFSVWLDLRNKQTELWGALSANGGQNWSENILIYKSPDGHICECCHPSVAFTSSGKVVVMWRNWLKGSRDMFWAESDDGRTFGSANKFGSGTWPLNGCPMDGGSLTFDTGGKPISVWRRAKNIFSATDSGSESLLAEDGTQPVIANSDGKNYFLWQHGKDLLLKTNGSAPAKVLARNAAYPSVAASTHGAPVVVWESTDKQSIFFDVLE